MSPPASSRSAIVLLVLFFPSVAMTGELEALAVRAPGNREVRTERRTPREAARQRTEERLLRRIDERRRALERTPDDEELRIALAEDFSALGRYGAAAEEYRKVRQLHPERWDLAREEARIRSWNGDFRRSLGLYERLVAERPDDADLRLERARVLAWDGQLDHAARELSRLRSRDDVGPQAHEALADVYRWNGETRRAAEFYRVAIDQGLGGAGKHRAQEFLEQEQDFTVVEPQGAVFSDSDDLDVRWFGTGIERHPNLATSVRAQFLHYDYRQEHHDLTAEQGSLALEHSWPKLQGLLRFGLAGYSTGEIVPVANAQLAYAGYPGEGIGIAYDRYNLIDELAPLASATGDVLQGHRARLWVSESLPFGLRVAGNGSLSWISDGNRQVRAGATLGRRVLRRPRVALRADVQFLSVTDPTPRYWSPDSYVSTGLTVALEQPLVRRVGLFIEGRGGYAVEDRSPAAEVSYAVSLAADLPRGVQLRVGYSAGESARTSSDGGGYESGTGTVDLRYRFGP